jgi:BolA protein
MTVGRVERIRTTLERQLAPQHLEIMDDSAAHAGHAGARSGGHFRVLIVAEAFRGQTARQRHQTVYAALGGLMNTDVHALSIRALAPGEESSGRDSR